MKIHPKMTRKQAAEMADFLEDQGWNIFNGNEFACQECGQTVTGSDWSYCPSCGISFDIKPAQKDKDEYNSTLDLLIKAVTIGFSTRTPSTRSKR